jgi:hypothetical protein
MESRMEILVFGKGTVLALPAQHDDRDVVLRGAHPSGVELSSGSPFCALAVSGRSRVMVAIRSATS